MNLMISGLKKKWVKSIIRFDSIIQILRGHANEIWKTKSGYLQKLTSLSKSECKLSHLKYVIPKIALQHSDNSWSFVVADFIENLFNSMNMMYLHLKTPPSSWLQGTVVHEIYNCLWVFSAQELKIFTKAFIIEVYLILCLMSWI